MFSVIQKNNVGAMYGAAVAHVILQQPDKARLQLKNIVDITWNMQVCHVTDAWQRFLVRACLLAPGFQLT